MGTPDSVFRKRLQEIEEGEYGYDYTQDPYWSTRDTYADAVAAVTPEEEASKAGPSGFLDGVFGKLNEPRERRYSPLRFPMTPWMDQLASTLHGRQFIESAAIRPAAGALGIAEQLGSQKAGELRDDLDPLMLTPDESAEMPWLTRTIAQAAGSSVLPILTGGAGLAVTGGRIAGGLVGAAVGAYAGSADEMQRELEGAGVEGDGLKYGVLVGGAMIAALEGVVPAGVAKVGMGGIKRKVGQSLGVALTRIVGQQSLEEAGTEAIQQQIPALAKAILADHPYFTMEQLMQTLESAAAGAVGGAFLGGAGSVTGLATEQNQRVRELADEITAGVEPSVAAEATKPYEGPALVDLPQTGEADPGVVSQEELGAFEPAGMEVTEEEADDGAPPPTTPPPKVGVDATPAAEQELKDRVAATAKKDDPFDLVQRARRIAGLDDAGFEQNVTALRATAAANETQIGFDAWTIQEMATRMREDPDYQPEVTETERQRAAVEDAGFEFTDEPITPRERALIDEARGLEPAPPAEAPESSVSLVDEQAAQAPQEALIAPTVETAPVETEDVDALILRRRAEGRPTPPGDPHPEVMALIAMSPDERTAAFERIEREEGASAVRRAVRDVEALTSERRIEPETAPEDTDVGGVVVAPKVKLTEAEIEEAAPEATPVENIEEIAEHIANEQGSILGPRDQAVEVGESIKVGAQGEATAIITANDQEYQATYAIVAYEDAPSSHNPITFQRNPEYKGRAQDQERTYESDTAAQEHVATRSQRLNPKKLLDATGSPAEGPAIILPDGNRVSGNGRGMMLSRAATMHPNKYQAYLDALVDEAENFGMTAEDARAEIDQLLAQGKTPELVRIMDTNQTLPTTAELVSQFNAESQKSMPVLAEAATRSRRLRNSPAVEILTDRIEADETVRAFLGTSRSRAFMESMREHGVISQEEMGELLDPETELLNSEGKALVENMLLSLAIGDAEAIARALPSSRVKIEKAVPAIIQLENYGEGWEQIQTVLRDALNAQATASNFGMAINALNDQQQFFEEDAVQYSENALIVAGFIEENGARRVTAAIRSIADDALASKGGDLFGDRAATLDDSIRQHMGGTLGTLREDSEALVYDPQTGTGRQIPMFDKSETARLTDTPAEIQQELADDPEQTYLFPDDPQIQQDLGELESYQSEELRSFAFDYINKHYARIFGTVSEREAVIEEGMRPAREMAHRNQFNLVGLKVMDTAHLARLLRFTRSPLVENLSLLVIGQDGKVAYHSIVTSGMLDRVNPGRATENALADITRQGLKGSVYIAHNHPSGNPTPSPADHHMTGQFASIINKTPDLRFDGHIILDHETATFMYTSGRFAGKVHFGTSQLSIRTQQVDWTVSDDVSLAEHPELIVGLMAAANDPHRIDVVFLDAETRVLALEPINGWESKVETLEADIAAAAQRIGSTSHLIVVPTSEAAETLAATGYPASPLVDTEGRSTAVDGDVMVLGNTKSMQELAETEYLAALEPLVADPRQGRRQLDSLQREAVRINQVVEGWLNDETLREEVETLETVGVESVMSEWPEVEERYQEAKRNGITDKGWAAIFTTPAGWGSSVHTAMSRHFKHLNPHDPTHAVVADMLRRFESSWDAASAKAKLSIYQWSEGLSDEQNDLVSRLLVLPDMERQFEQGELKEGSEYAFGYANIEQVQADLARFRRMAQSDPKVLTLMRLRESHRLETVRELVDLGILPERVLEDPRYYHRQVLEYHRAMKEQQKASASREGGFDLHTRRQGFQRSRSDNALDFNTEWRVAEVEWLTQAMYATEFVRTQDQIQRLTDIADQLEREATSFNTMVAFQRATEQGRQGEFKAFRKNIAIANGQLANMAMQGELDGGREYQGLVGQLEEEYREWKQLPRSERLERPFRFSHPSWHQFLRFLLDERRAGSAQAGSTFQAIGDRNRLIRDMMGDDFKTVYDMVPEGYALWQPEPGNVTYPGITVAEQILDEIYRTEVLPDRGKFKEARILGGPKETWIVPKEIAETLNQIRKPITRGPFRGAIVGWKQWILLSPGRAGKYNVNNMSGDLDIALAYSPRMVQQQFMSAARDLHAFYYGNPSDELVAEMNRHLDNAVIQSGFSSSEVPGLDSPEGNRLLRGLDNVGIIRKYWRFVRKATNYRESILRLAAVRHFEAKIAEGGRPIGVSRKHEMDALYASSAISDQQIAAKLARELIGDYGNISAAGEYLRNHHFPFWSWMEINTPRYVRLVLNARYKQEANEIRETEDGRDVQGGNVVNIGKAAARGGVVVGKRAVGGALKSFAKVGITANILSLLMTIYNRTVWPDEWEEIDEARKQQHLIIGRNDDGSVRSIRLEGALVDALRWFDLHDAVGDIDKVAEGTKTFGDVGAELVRGPFERLWQSWNPYAKTAMEVVLGKSTFPRVFEEGKDLRFAGRPIRDRKEHAARLFDMQRFVQFITRKPTPDLGPVETVASWLITYRTDPGEAAYWLTRQSGARFMRERYEKEWAGGNPTKRSNALYYYKRALKWSDEDAAEHWLDEYIDLGGTDEGLTQSIRLAAPEGLVPKKYQDEWLDWMQPSEVERFDRAYDWYTEVYAPSQ